MSFVLASIVEGKAEVQALPVLLRRMLAGREGTATVRIRTPIRSPRDRFINREEERRKSLELARRACQGVGGGHILVLLDADDDCPAALGETLLEQCRTSVSDGTPISVVLADREYEAWFLASAESLAGVRDFDLSRITPPADPDGPRNAKGLIRDATGGRYGPAKDQAALSARIDPTVATRRSRSFRKLAKELDRIVATLSPPV